MFTVLKVVFTFRYLKILKIEAISLLTYVNVSNFISSLVRQLFKVVIFLNDK